MIDIKVPTVGESISEVTLVKWLKQDGDWVDRDEQICELESEKATFELNAEQAGLLKRVAAEGDTLKIGAVVAQVDTQATRPARTKAAPANENPAPEAPKTTPPDPKVTKPAAQQTASREPEPQGAEPSSAQTRATPVAATIMAEKKIDPAQVKGSGPLGRILKNDVYIAMAAPSRVAGAAAFSRGEQREKMSNLRKTVSRRLVEARNSTAMLTTFNEVDLGRIMELRKTYKEPFKAAHGVGLGFMSFFTRASCIALTEWPSVNAYIDGEELIYHDYCDISIAVSAPKGLVVPVIRNAESLSMAQIESKVAELAAKARENKLTVEEMTGGTFTLTNGGVFGSLMSTPIINIPQSAILGMHKIQERPVAIGGQVVVRPMMYVALSYDHRIIDGRESVSFLVRVKELLENPEQLLLGKDPVRELLGV